MPALALAVAQSISVPRDVYRNVSRHTRLASRGRTRPPMSKPLGGTYHHTINAELVAVAIVLHDCDLSDSTHQTRA